jgi:hypothetical protein
MEELWEAGKQQKKDALCTEEESRWFNKKGIRAEPDYEDEKMIK